MREIGIPFNGWSMGRLLAGKKTMTARLMKPQPKPDERLIEVEDMDGETVIHTGLWVNRDLEEFRCRYHVGDLMYVKETIVNCGIAAHYAADYAPLVILTEHVDFLNKPCIFVPVMFMPKWAARIWLECLDVKPRTVQEFTDEDFIAEGCTDGEQEYRTVWDVINAKQGYGWDVQDWWVWQIKFRKVEHANL